MDWDADFAGLPPIELPDGRKLETLADLRGYILALPKRERLAWNDAVAALLKAAEHGGPFCFLTQRRHGAPFVAVQPLSTIQLWEFMHQELSIGDDQSREGQFASRGRDR